MMCLLLEFDFVHHLASLLLFRKVCPRQKKGHTHTYTIRFYFFNFFFFLLLRQRSYAFWWVIWLRQVFGKGAMTTMLKKKGKRCFAFCFTKQQKQIDKKVVAKTLLLVYNCYISFKLLFHLNYPARNSDISNNSDILFAKLICNYFGFKPSETVKKYQ